MEKTLLTDEDRKYLEGLKIRVQGLLEFSLLGLTPGSNDRIVLERPCPYIAKDMKAGSLLTMEEALALCQAVASNRMIYEAWVESVMDNVHLMVASLGHDDGRRLMAYFNAQYGADPAEIRVESRSALWEAARALYAE